MHFLYECSGWRGGVPLKFVMKSRIRHAELVTYSLYQGEEKTRQTGGEFMNFKVRMAEMLTVLPL